MAKRVTIQDIADELGLSRNTVSKALNNAEGLADATRERVLQKAVDMGYKQFAYARDFIDRRAWTPDETLPTEKREIALISTVYLAAPHFSSLMIDAFQRELAQLGLTLNTHRVSEDEVASLSLPMTFAPERVAAIICFEMFDQRYSEMLCALDIPVLFVDSPARINGEPLAADQLYMDNTTGITQLVNHLLAQGHQRIGFLGNWEHCRSFFERYMAFRGAMLLAGVPVEDRFCIKGNDPDEIGAALKELNELPDAFLCANDFVAFDVLQLLRVLGYNVPDDVLIAGFDDSSESRRCMPQLTTVHIHTQVMAFSAVQLILTRLREPGLDYRQMYTQADLILRASTERPA